MTGCEENDVISLKVHKIKNNKSITYSIKNSTNNDYVFYIDKTDIRFTSGRNFYFNSLFLLIQDEKGDSILPSLSMYYPSDKFTQELIRKEKKEKRKDSLLLKSYERLGVYKDIYWIKKNKLIL
jgi:hypothetical protein